MPSHLEVGGKIYSDDVHISNLFNDHFENIISTVNHDNVPESPDWSFLTEFVESKLSPGLQFSIPPFTEEFVESSFSRLLTNKAAGFDQVTGFFLKTAAPAIASSLASIFNLSLSTGLFRDA